jgi:predicted Fe-S protein YdhL (DUF1289 family)
MVKKLKTIPSPCLRGKVKGSCTLDENGLCIICRRSGDQITDWSSKSYKDKNLIWRQILLSGFKHSNYFNFSLFPNE